MPERKCSDLVAAWMRYTENSESSRRYHKWACLSAISAALQRKVYIRWGHTTIFPNQYIILLGPSGRARKGEPIEIAKRMLTQVGVNTTSEAVTRQQLIRRIKMSFNRVGGPVGYYTGHCSMTCISGEFAAFLGEGDTQFLVDLTDWYDSRDKWTYDTKHEGTDEIIGVCFNILGAMAPDWIPHCIPIGAIGGGFTSRLLWVVEYAKERLIPNPNLIALDEGLESVIVRDLEAIHMMSGEYILHSHALQLYEDWYVKEEKRVIAGEFPLKDPRFSGYIARRATHVKKIAMTLAASRSDVLVIEDTHMKQAISELEDLEKDFGSIFSGVGTSPHVRVTGVMLDILRERGELKLSEAARIFYSDATRSDLQQVEDMLLTMQVIRKTVDALSGDVTYTLTEGQGQRAAASSSHSPHPLQSAQETESGSAPPE